MTFIIKNISHKAVEVDNVSIDPGRQYTFHAISPSLADALDAGTLELKMEDPGEHIDLKPFHTGDKAIDG